MRNFEKILPPSKEQTEFEKQGRKKYARWCVRCGKKFKTTKYGMFCDKCKIPPYKGKRQKLNT